MKLHLFVSGQDYYYNNGGPSGYHVTLQQQQRQHPYTNNFFTNNGAGLATSYQNRPGQSQAAAFQLPARPLQQYDPFQPFHTNQHLPQPFHHHVTATPQYDFQQQFYQNEKDLTSQNYYDVHPQGLIDQLDTGNRWRQNDARKFSTPGPSIDSFDDQSIVNIPVSSTPVVYKIEDDSKITRVDASKKKPSRGLSNRGNNLTTYRPRIAASESEIVGLEVSEPPRSRNRNKITRTDSRVVKPTTYTPSSTPFALNRQRSRYTRPNKDLKEEATTLRTEPTRAYRNRGTARLNLNRFSTVHLTTPSTTTVSTTVSTTTDPNAEYEFYDYELAPQNEADGPLSIDQLEANLGPPEALLRPDFNLRQHLDNNSFYDVLRPFDDLNIPYDREPKPVVDPYKLVREPSITTFRSKIPFITTTTTTTSTTSRTTTTPEPETEIYDDTTPKPSDKDQVRPPVVEDSPQPTESWVIVASVQTSRSVSGARFLPSDLIKQEELPKPRTPNGGIERTPKTIEISTIKPSQEDVSADMKDHAHSSDSSKSHVSTESIIDKLDRVQSELSSGILSFRHGDNKLELEPLPDMTSDKIETPADASTTITTTSTTTSTTTPTTTTAEVTTTESTTEGSYIRKFVPANKRTTTTGKPSIKKSILDSIEFDDLSPSLLPAGFKQRGFKPKTARTTTIRSPIKDVQNDEAKPSSREGSGRSTGGTFKNKIKLDDISAFLPSGYKKFGTTTTTPNPSTTTKVKQKSVASLFGKITFDDISALLPEGYKEKSEKTEKVPKEEKKPTKPSVEIPSNLLPPGYKPPSNPQEDKAESKNNSLIESLLNKVKFKNVDSLLPPGYKDSKSSTEAPETTTTTKLVFPTRPGVSGKTSPPRSPGKTKSGGGLSPLVPKINKGWPVRYGNTLRYT